MNFAIDFTDTNIRTMATPFVVSILCILLMRLFLGPWRTSVLAPIAVGIGFLASYFLILGLPVWPVEAVLRLTPYAVLFGIIIGAVFDFNTPSNTIFTMLHIALTITLVFWVASIWHDGTIHQNEMVLYGILILAGFFALQSMNEQRDENLAPAISLFSGLIGISVIAHFYGTRTGLFSTALAAATLGLIIWNWPKCRYPWGASGTLIGGGIYIILASELVIKNPALAMPVGLTLFCFIMHPITHRVFPTNPTFQPLIQILFSIIPIVGAGYLTSQY